VTREWWAHRERFDANAEHDAIHVAVAAERAGTCLRSCARRKSLEPTDMWKDPIVEELHEIRRKLAKECHNDIGEIIAHLRKRSRDAGRKTVTLRRTRVAKPPARAKTRRQRTA
jgi:hypothetical protein